jgi:hypothetical protein
MAAQRKRRRAPWGTLIIAVILLAVGIAILVYVPSSPLDRTHVTKDTSDPGQVTLPPTAPLPTPTFTLSPATTAGASPSPTR